MLWCLKHVEALNLNLSDRRLRLTLDLARELMGAPRHLSQHPGGFVLTHDRLDDLVPIEPAAMVDRQVIEWDKDDIDALRFMKVDVLALGMLTCMKKAFDFLAGHKARSRSRSLLDGKEAEPKPATGADYDRRLLCRCYHFNSLSSFEIGSVRRRSACQALFRKRHGHDASP